MLPPLVRFPVSEFLGEGFKLNEQTDGETQKSLEPHN